jgi:hypothetical protein
LYSQLDDLLLYQCINGTRDIYYQLYAFNLLFFLLLRLRLYFGFLVAAAIMLLHGNERIDRNTNTKFWLIPSPPWRFADTVNAWFACIFRVFAGAL